MKKIDQKLSWGIALAVALSIVVITAGDVQAASKKLDATTKFAVKKKPPKVIPGNATPLTTSDCKLLLNGSVVEVTDGRCGASGKYCQSSAGAACITQ
jgi:hypothetical protein